MQVIIADEFITILWRLPVSMGSPFSREQGAHRYAAALRIGRKAEMLGHSEDVFDRSQQRIVIIRCVVDTFARPMVR